MNLTTRNAFSVVVSSAFKIFESTHTDYTIIVEDTITSDTYEIIVPDNTYTYTQSQNISLIICEYNELYYTPSSINTSSGNIYSKSGVCSINDTIAVTGIVISINKPNQPY